MSVPKEKLHKLVDLIPEEDNEEVVTYLENYINKKQKKNEFDPTQYIGILADLDIDVEEECKKMRDEWEERENREWDCQNSSC
ncbi:MAG: hypothetical protein A2Y25_04665 [Candidatus Melainabacteria bacterium GWF2_37_15]|nr:MAG: hypothetical protein A2Y25_04665 [Candidatus Melainabacteria bacterium GWF2_37_15]